MNSKLAKLKGFREWGFLGILSCIFKFGDSKETDLTYSGLGNIVWVKLYDI